MKDLKNLIFDENYKPVYLIGSGNIDKKRFKDDYVKKYFDFPSSWIDFSQTKKKKKNIITYIDENIYHSKDLMLRGKKRKKILNPEIFLKDLKNFFEIIEKQTGLKVVISCSKKYKKYKKNLFGKRKIFLW